MPKQYDSEHIWQMLQKNRYCTVADHASDGTINTRVMAFACSRDLKEFYLMTPKMAPKLKGFLSDPNVSLLVFTQSKDPNECSQIAVRGRMTVHREMNSVNIKKGFQLLAEKVGMMDPKLMTEQNSDYVFLVLQPKELTLTMYFDMLHDMPPTKITM
jgi:hypothetical protein